MRLCVAISLVIVASLANGINVSEDDVIGSKKLLQLSTRNPGDVYLVANFLACINAYSCMDPAISLELDSPLGFLVQSIFIFEYDGCLVFFNKTTAKLLLIIPTATMNEVLVQIKVMLDIYRLPLDNAFNAYLGINNVSVNKSCKELFNYIGNVLAELVGIGGKPVAALNLLGLLNFHTIFPPDLVVIQPYSCITYMLVTKQTDLALMIAQTSIIVDGAAFSAKHFYFQDIIFPAITCSGYKIGNVIGKKDALNIIPQVLAKMVALVPYEETSTILCQLLMGVSIDANIDQILADFFDAVDAAEYPYYGSTEPSGTTEGY
ncbi:hypothetical protein DMENIID0001_030670 [Sergentomyia squamirostris]